MAAEVTFNMTHLHEEAGHILPDCAEHYEPSEEVPLLRNFLSVASPATEPHQLAAELAYLPSTLLRCHCDGFCLPDQGPQELCTQ